MNTRQLGQTGLEMDPFILGGNVFGWTIGQDMSFRILDGFVEAGFRWIDTADCYFKFVPGNKGGESEEILGHWMRERKNRDQLYIATKVGVEMAPGKKGLSRAYLMEAVEASLRRLQTDYIDLYQSHVDDRDTAMDETLETYSRLMQQGKVRTIGASNFTAERFGEALELSNRRGYPRYESLQPQYNLYDRAEYEDTLAPVCRKHGVRVITYFSLASGFLTGKYRSSQDLGKSQRGMGISRYLNERGYRILGCLDEVARDRDSTPGIVALAWLLTRPGVTSFIASATNPDQLADLVTATTLTLDDASVSKLDEASDWREIHAQTQSA